MVKVAESLPARSDDTKIGVCRCSESRGVLRLVSRDEKVRQDIDAGEGVRDERELVGDG